MKNRFADSILQPVSCINFLTQDFYLLTIEFSQSLLSACHMGINLIPLQLEKTVVFIQKSTSTQIYIKNMTDIFNSKNISGSVNVQIINN